MKTHFTQTLIKWYNLYKRDLPWRKTKDPYKIWISEIILQQTRIQQGLSYYQRFTEEFSTISELANAPEEKILKLWQGLGYYSRARNLHSAAKTIQQNFNGKFPDNYAELLKLKGVGSYTAAAIASICFELPIPVIDGNVFRFVSRFLGMEVSYDDMNAKKQIYSFLDKKIRESKPSIFNQAVMEMGALICTPSNPKCETCPFQNSCKAFQNNKVSEIPQPKKSIEITHRYFTYFLFHYPENDEFCTLIRQRTENDIWKNLYEFPLLETKSKPTATEISLFLERFGLNNVESIVLSKNEIKHQLSHQQLHAYFTIIKSKPKYLDNYVKINISKLDSVAVPVLICKIITKSEITKIIK